MKKLLALCLAMMLCGCSVRSAQVVRPSAVPDRILTKTAIPPSNPDSAENPEADPWQECAGIGTGGITVMTAAEIPSEEFLRRLRITYMIQEPKLADTAIAVRCMNGKLYTCPIDAENRCFEQPDLSPEPNQAMKRICEELKDGILTDSAVDRNTAYAWGCRDGEAVILAQIRETDAAGYDRSAWAEIPAP